MCAFRRATSCRASQNALMGQAFTEPLCSTQHLTKIQHAPTQSTLTYTFFATWLTLNPHQDG